MGFLIDSGIFIAMERGDLADETLEARAGQEPCFVSTVTVSELWHGVHRANSTERAARRARFIQQCLQQTPMRHLEKWTPAQTPSLPIDDFVARQHAILWATLESLGTMIGVHDSWIAATALVHDFTLATRNAREFRRVPGLRVEIW